MTDGEFEAFDLGWAEGFRVGIRAAIDFLDDEKMDQQPAKHWANLLRQRFIYELST